MVVGHTLRVNDASARAAANTSGVKLDKHGLDLLDVRADDTGEDGVTNRLTADEKMAVRSGLVHEAHHLDPQPAS